MKPHFLIRGAHVISGSIAARLIQIFKTLFWNKGGKIMKVIVKLVSILLIFYFFHCVIPTINVFAEPLPTQGPSGGTGGKEFSDQRVPENAKVSEVRIWSGKFIDAIQMVHETSDGKLIELEKHGGRGGNFASFRLERDEYITGIKGWYGQYIDSIRIITNKQVSIHYGGKGGGSEFFYEAPPGFEVVGFIGRSGQYIDSIGIVMREYKK